MASLVRTLAARLPMRQAPALPWDTWASLFSYQFQLDGLQYSGLSSGNQLGSPQADYAPSFDGYVDAAYRSNGVVFACIRARQLLFSQARFQFQRTTNGRPGPFFGTTDLGILEKPGGPKSALTTADLLSWMMVDSDLSGNFYAVRDGDRIRRLIPSYVTIILGSQSDPDNPRLAWDAEPLGYVYKPPRTEEKVFLAEQVAHYAPLRDPLARYRGISWMTSVLPETVSLNAMTSHQRKYFENGASPSYIVTIDQEMNETAFKRWLTLYREQNEGIANAYKTMVLTAGAKPVVTGNNLQDFKTVKGHSETVIAAASGMHPVIIGLSEGLQGSSLNAGNFQQARRVVADVTLRPLWTNAAASLTPLVQTPPTADLVIDTREIPFLREDAKDAADIQSIQANTIHTYIAAGFEPDSVVAAVDANDRSLLAHTGLYSVQLQPAGSITEGKGSVVQGVPTPITKQLPAPKNGKPKAASARALLEAFIVKETP